MNQDAPPPPPGPQIAKDVNVFTYKKLIMPPGTIVPMGAYCFYCVRMYVCPSSVKVFG